MKQLIALPLIAMTAFGLSGCAKQSETGNVAITDTSSNLEDANVAGDATDATLNEAANSSNAADLVTNG